MKAIGRPREFNTDVVLERALHLFWIGGYEGTSIGDLTSAMEISRPSLYSAFGDKEGLFLQVVELYAGAHAQGPLDAFRRAESFSDGVKAFFRKTITLTHGPTGGRGCLIACTLADAAGRSKIFRDELKRLHQETLRELAVIVAEKTCSAEADVSASAAALLLLMTGLAVEARAGSSRDNLLKFANVAADSVLSLSPGVA